MIENGAPFHVGVVEAPGQVVVKPVGDIDLSTAPTLAKAAGELVRGPSATLIVDMDGVDFCDSAGINALVRLRNTCHDAGWGFAVMNLRGHIHQVIVELTGLGEFLNVRAT